MKNLSNVSQLDLILWIHIYRKIFIKVRAEQINILLRKAHIKTDNPCSVSLKKMKMNYNTKILNEKSTRSEKFLKYFNSKWNASK